MVRERSERRKEYIRLKVRQRVRDLKKKCLEYLGDKCERCGYDKCPSALHFHHKNPEEKDFELSHVTCSAFNDKIKQELDKCIVLCSNCHAEVHWEESTEKLNSRIEKWYSDPSVRKNNPSIIIKCSFCSKDFKKSATRIKENNFCSVKCKTDFANKDWPDNETFIELAKKHSLKELEKMLGKTYDSIRAKKKRLGIT